MKTKKKKVSDFILKDPAPLPELPSKYERRKNGTFCSSGPHRTWAPRTITTSGIASPLIWRVKYAKSKLSMLILPFRFTNNSELYVTQKFGRLWPHCSSPGYAYDHHLNSALSHEAPNSCCKILSLKLTLYFLYSCKLQYSWDHKYCGLAYIVQCTY